MRINWLRRFAVPFSFLFLSVASAVAQPCGVNVCQSASLDPGGMPQRAAMQTYDGRTAVLQQYRSEDPDAPWPPPSEPWILIWTSDGDPDLFIEVTDDGGVLHGPSTLVLPFDVDADGVVDTDDVMIVLNELGSKRGFGVRSNVDGDSGVDISDLFAVVEHLGETHPQAGTSSGGGRCCMVLWGDIWMPLACSGLCDAIVVG